MSSQGFLDFSPNLVGGKFGCEVLDDLLQKYFLCFPDSSSPAQETTFIYRGSVPARPSLRLCRAELNWEPREGGKLESDVGNVGAEIEVCGES